MFASCASGKILPIVAILPDQLTDFDYFFLLATTKEAMEVVDHLCVSVRDLLGLRTMSLFCFFNFFPQFQLNEQPTFITHVLANRLIKSITFLLNSL